MTITCPQCKHQNPDDAEFCENCGAQLPVSAPVGLAPNSAGYSTGGSTLGSASSQAGYSAGGPVNQMVCPTCRAPLAPGDEFCFNCGTDVRNLTSVGQPPAQPVAMSTDGADPMSATVSSSAPPASQPQPQPPGMKDADLDCALAEIDNPPAASGSGNGDPADAPTMVGSVQVQNSPVADTGPEAQPFNSQGQPVPPPAPVQTNSGSIPVQPGPQGGVAGNAFGAPANLPPVSSNATQSVPVMPRQGSTGALVLQISGPYGDEKVEWKGSEILLGRNDAKTRVFPEVNLDDNAASRRHLSVWKDDTDSMYYAQDLESANGTLLNGRDLRPGEPTLLNNGDVLKIGTRYSIKVQIS